MDEKTRSELIAAGAEALAGALLQLASRHDDAAEMVARLLASPGENFDRFRARLEELGELRDRGEFYDWREVNGLAMEIRDALDELAAAEPTPREGVEAVAELFAAFKPIIESCDDSNGNVSMAFEYDARDHFVAYAKLCRDFAFLEETVVRLCRDDDYGITQSIVRAVSDFLPPESLRRLVERFKAFAGDSETEAGGYWAFDLVEILAKQLGDPALFVWSRKARRPDLRAGDHLEIAEAYLGVEDAENALVWLRSAPAEPYLDEWERDELLMAALALKGDREGAVELAWKRFREHRSSQTLDDLLGLIGKDEREKVLGEGWELIQTEARFSLTDLVFLVEQDRIDDADEYAVARASQLDGSRWGELTVVAAIFSESARSCAASAVYRALLESILQRGYSKAYDHGAHYFKTLEMLKVSVADWRGLPDHDRYVARLRKAHGRKWSFWQRVEG